MRLHPTDSIVDFVICANWMYNICMSKRLNYYVTDKQYEQLQTIKKATGLSVSEHVRRALDQYIKVVFKELKLKEEREDG